MRPRAGGTTRTYKTRVFLDRFTLPGDRSVDAVVTVEAPEAHESFDHAFGTERTTIPDLDLAECTLESCSLYVGESFMGLYLTKREEWELIRDAALVAAYSTDSWTTSED